MTEDMPRRRSPVLMLLLLVALAVVLAGIFPFRQILAQQRQVENTAAKHSALVAENERLQAEIELLHTDQAIERIAREEFGLVMPGETAYVAVTPPGSEREVEPAPAAPYDDDRRIWQRVLDFLTGRDLVPEE